MAAYTNQVAPHAGLSPTETAPAASGNTAPCGSGLGLLIRTTSGPNTVTITVPAGITFDGLGIGNATPGSGSRSVVVANNTYAVSPLVAGTYMDPTTSLATFAVSGTLTSVLWSVISISA
jgi:peptidoglycan hydrolase-like protein with peptidoglycan-binding domain